MNAECSDDVSLKKLLKTKQNGLKKTVNPISTAAEYDMERLCRAKAILEKMMQKVVKLQNGKARKSSKTRPLEESVVYIPIAELRGKNWYTVQPIINLRSILSNTFAGGAGIASYIFCF